MAGKQAENQQRRAEEAARNHRIRTSLRESFQASRDDDDRSDQSMQLLTAFENLCDHATTKEEFDAFLTHWEKKGYKQEDVSLELTRWVSQTLHKVIDEKDAEIQDLNGEAQVLDADLADARKELAETQTQLEEQRSVVRALVAGSRQASPAPDQTTRATSKKFPDPSVWKSGTPSEWKQWKMSLRAKLKNNADWFSDENARKDFIMKVIADESWEIAEPYFQDNAATVDTILEALDYRWADPMEKQTARSEYQAYLQLTKPFAEFIAKFQTLARTAEIPEEIQIEDLRTKMSFDLQSQAASYEPKDLRSFIAYLQRTARNLEQVKQQRQRASQARRERGGAAGSNTQRPTSSQGPSTAQSFQSPQQSLPTDTKDSSDKTCLNCEKKGHLYRSCPEPVQPGRDDRVKAMRERFEAKRNNTIAGGNRIYELTGETKAVDAEKPQPGNGSL